MSSGLCAGLRCACSRGRLGHVEGSETPRAVGMLGARSGQCVQLSCGVVAFRGITRAVALEIRPHRPDQVAAFENQLVAQVQAEEIDSDLAASVLVPLCAAGHRNEAAEADQFLGPHVFGADRIDEERPFRLIELVDAVAVGPTRSADRKAGLLLSSLHVLHETRSRRPPQVRPTASAPARRCGRGSGRSQYPHLKC